VLALSLVITAAVLPRLAAVRQLAGGTAVPLAAGVCALIALLAARLPLGFSWGPAGSERAAPEVARGFAVGAACAAALIWQGNDALLARLWRDDRAASLALLAGVAAWGGAVAATRHRALVRWYGAAAAAALLPVILLVVVLRPVVPASGFAAAFIFFLVADTTVALVTEELAFRRALVGPPESAGLGALALMAVVFGLWHAVQPGYGGDPLGTLLGTALGGFVAGCVYVLSRSLTAAASFAPSRVREATSSSSALRQSSAAGRRVACSSSGDSAITPGQRSTSATRSGVACGMALVTSAASALTIIVSLPPRQRIPFLPSSWMERSVPTHSCAADHAPTTRR